jgi:hypothetical protein
MLVFDDGTFSESGTVLLSDSISHIPPEVLAKNFGVSEQALTNLPNHELFIFHTAGRIQHRADGGGRWRNSAGLAPRGNSPRYLTRQHRRMTRRNDEVREWAF